MLCFDKLFQETSIDESPNREDDYMYLKKTVIIIIAFYGWISPFSMSTVNFAVIKGSCEPGIDGSCKSR